MSTFPRKRLRPSGGYRKTASFQTTTLIYDSTYWFCEKFHNGRLRMIDQMVQAARSGRQNIAEGSRAAATTSQTELRLINVARASLEELLLDYEDYLRHRHLPQWDPEGPEAKEVRNVPWAFQKRDRPDPSDPSDPKPPRLPELRFAHGLAHRQGRQKCRQPILGLHCLSRLQGHCGSLICEWGMRVG